MILDENSMEIESEGYTAGQNPMMGELKIEFKFSAVPYGHKNKKKFVDNVQEQLKNIHYAFNGEVKLEIDIYLDEQKRYETPELADLDNYAKLICDSIKGPKGILIDDSQIQSLSVIWIDTPSFPNFSIKIIGHPDEFIMKPVIFYEMPDELFYPISSKVWTTTGVKEVSEEVIQFLLVELHQVVKNKISFRHSLRKSGMNKLQAYWQSKYIAPLCSPYHKNRIIESEYIINTLKDWKDNIKFDLILQKLHAQ